MDITTANQILFPVVLFVIILSSFYIDINLFSNSNTFNSTIISNHYFSFELEHFFEKVSQDSVLLDKLEAVFKEENFIEQITVFGNSLGYNFTASDVRRSIAEHTANLDGSYICLPFGCWQIG